MSISGKDTATSKDTLAPEYDQNPPQHSRLEVIPSSNTQNTSNSDTNNSNTNNSNTQESIVLGLAAIQTNSASSANSGKAESCNTKASVRTVITTELNNAPTTSEVLLTPLLHKTSKDTICGKELDNLSALLDDSNFTHSHRPSRIPAPPKSPLTSVTKNILNQNTSTRSRNSPARKAPTPLQSHRKTTVNATQSLKSRSPMDSTADKRSRSPMNAANAGNRNVSMTSRSRSPMSQKNDIKTISNQTIDSTTKGGRKKSPMLGQKSPILQQNDESNLNNKIEVETENNNFSPGKMAPNENQNQNEPPLSCASAIISC